MGEIVLYLYQPLLSLYYGSLALVGMKHRYTQLLYEQMDVLVWLYHSHAVCMERGGVRLYLLKGGRSELLFACTQHSRYAK